MARQGKYPLNVTENGKRGGGFGSGKQREGDNHDFWERSAQKDHLTILDGKKISLRKTHETQTETNDQVWELNESVEKAMSYSARIYKRYEEVGNAMLDVDREVED